MKMLLASFAVMSLVFAGCQTSTDEATDETMMEENAAMMDDSSMEAEVEVDAAMETGVTAE